MADHSRRRFLKGAGLAVGGLTLGVTPVSAGSGDDQRFLVDLKQVDRSDVPDDVEIVHDISQIDLLAARGDPDAVPGGDSTAPDIAVQRDDAGPPVEHGGPNASGRSNSHNHDGAPTNTEYQWDKRVQDVNNELTDKPGGGKSIHDTTAGEGTRVAVVDTGVYDDHPDLAGVVNEDLSENFTTDDYDWRPNGAGDHGTHVAGIIAGTNDNDGPAGGVLGTAPETEIVAHRVFSGVEGASGDSIAALVAAAEKGCDAANFSVGYPPLDPEAEGVQMIVEAYERVVEYARANDMVFVNSAGNAGIDMTPESVLSLPTEVEGVFGVSATGPIGYGWGGKHADNEAKWLTGNRLQEPTTEPAFYTNYGEGVDVSAAGGNADLDAIGAGNEAAYNDLVYSTVYETTDDGETAPGYGWKAGTSMAAPQVAGAVALVRSLRPDASAEEVEALIRETASAPAEGELYHGDGHLDLEALVAAAE
ncbi:MULTISPECIES: S8 family serine peptidase [Halobacterium]|uniref:S8 family peptidase n=1 Tax=Halobacterium TaxID=2239 RepID=UPI00073E8F53|nr:MULTISPECIES: S8 family serine peptidase [Halobacterium]MCG1002964.1 S8 family serine peptidase [Halobacterium noricense]